MAATSIQLDINDATAKKVVKLAIENGAYSDDMPTDKKAIKEAAQEAVEYCIDSWVNDGVRPDDDDADIAAAGEAIMEIFEAAGIEVDEEGNIATGEAEPEGDDDPDPDGDGEEAFNPDDYIEDWTDMDAKNKVKALDDLDLDDDDTVGIVRALYEWEEQQDKPSSRVLSWIEETLGEPESEPEAESQDTMEEPWEGYDKTSAVDVKAVLNETLESDDGLDIEQVQYVKDYEEARERPRKRILDECDRLIALLEATADDDDGEAEPEAKPKPLGKKRGAVKQTAPEPSSNGAGSIVLTRDQILAALVDGEVEIDIA